MGKFWAHTPTQLWHIPSVPPLSQLLDLARPGAMSLVLTMADLHAVKGNAGDFNKLVFKQQRLRLKDSHDLHISASLKKLGVQAHNSLAHVRALCVRCLLVHDTFRRAARTERASPPS